MKDKVLGTIYGQAIGDAMGMPSELWPRKKVQEYFGYITEYLDGPETNSVAKNFSKGQFTDDTSQALVILDCLFESDFFVDRAMIAQRLIEWGEKNNAFEEEIFGPTSKAALHAIQQKQDARLITSRAETNGAAMRIAPIGLLFKTTELKKMVEYVREISIVTHSSDVALAGAAVIAGAVSAAKEDFTWDELLQFVYRAHDLGLVLGEPTYSASIKARIKLGIELAKKYETDEESFLQAIYDYVGSGVLLSESVPAAVSIAYYSRTVEKCAILCANLGGDTDTIGAMATAICGAKNGYAQIPDELIDGIDHYNDANLMEYGECLNNQLKKRGK